MRSLVFTGPDQVEWQERPDPKVQNSKHAVVRPVVIGRCDLDVGFVRGLAPMAPGTPLGHEVVGIVTDIGDDVHDFVPGDLVAVSAQICCGECKMCRRGFTGRCEAVPFAASYGMGRDGDFGGAAADLVLVPFADAMLFPLPVGANPADWIGFADMAQDGYRAVAPQLAERPGARVLVIGGAASVIGLYAAGIAVALGGIVDYYDSDTARLTEAKKYGAKPILRGNDEPEGMYEIVVDASIHAESILEAFRYAAPEAVVTSVCIHFGDVTAVPLMEAYHKGITYKTGRPNCRATMEPLSKLCCAGHFQPQLISTKAFDFNNAPEAWLDPAIRTIATKAAF
ncbi:MAG: alcohol dehydrogenase catalytic domain-containing protein [Kordiimonadaceae bacterium]|nr:alcohol dehydrogenase catalytic domain-containing protein [Kordiimonadaceae bacterium]MBO6568138.1 alcohol dehydrogenase catalytic domain-containing protein [Kordiimonadaceae bacterium]MBO6964132.1 alcohol dehydrogenase catalytic domain-containing protein [Kordiimonadaceae bacterium]